MVIVNNASDLTKIANIGIRNFVSIRQKQLTTPLPSYEPTTTYSEFIFVEAGDRATAIERAAGFQILRSLFDNLPFDHPEFFPSHEILEEHHYEQSKFYEMVFIFNDEGIVTTILIPDQDGIDTDLLALCRSWAAPISGPKVSGP